MNTDTLQKRAEAVLAMPAHQDSWLRGMLVAADWPRVRGLSNQICRASTSVKTVWRTERKSSSGGSSDHMANVPPGAR